MNEQIQFFEVPKKTSNKEKRNWENRFQRWSNNNLQNGLTSYGKCGYGSMCDYCEDMGYGRPCIRALNEMLRKKKKTIDYENADFIDIWNGDF